MKTDAVVVKVRPKTLLCMGPCGKWKLDAEFWTSRENRARRDRHNWCIECQSAKDRERRNIRTFEDVFAAMVRRAGK